MQKLVLWCNRSRSNYTLECNYFVANAGSLRVSAATTFTHQMQITRSHCMLLLRDLSPTPCKDEMVISASEDAIVWKMAFNPSGDILYVVMLTGNKIFEVDVESCEIKQMIEINAAASSCIEFMKVSPSGAYLCAGFGCKTIVLYNIKERTPTIFDLSVGMGCCDFAFDESEIFFGNVHGDLVRLDIKTMPPTLIHAASMEIGIDHCLHSKNANSIVLHETSDMPDGTIIHGLRKVNTETHQVEMDFEEYGTGGDWIAQCAISEDGSRIVTCGSHEGGKIWDAQTGLILHRFGNSNGVMSLKISGSTIVTFNEDGDGKVDVWDLKDGSRLNRVGDELPRNGTWRSSCIAISPAGDIVAQGAGNTLKFWNPF